MTTDAELDIYVLCWQVLDTWIDRYAFILFIQEVCTEYLSCARHWFSYLDYIRDKNRPRPSVYKAYLLMGRIRQETTNLVK